MFNLIYRTENKYYCKELTLNQVNPNSLVIKSHIRSQCLKLSE